MVFQGAKQGSAGGFVMEHLGPKAEYLLAFSTLKISREPRQHARARL
jgi:hypothetical protein